MCLPACFAGGIVAGLVLAAQARRSSARLETFAASASLALAAGSMGCGCVGLGGVVGAFLGLTLGRHARVAHSGAAARLTAVIAGARSPHPRGPYAPRAETLKGF